MGWARRLVQLPLLVPSEGMGSLLRLRWGGAVGRGLAALWVEVSSSGRPAWLRWVLLQVRGLQRACSFL